jgi:hypothetical protein
MRGVVVLTDRPCELHRDAQHRLHNEHGPAISYRDGWAVHAVHGVRVPAWIIEHPERITPELILKETNAEVRRVMLERYGWERFADHPDMRLVDEKPDPGNRPHTLRLYELPQEIRNVLGTPVRLLICHNATPERDGTRRTFGLTVANDMTDAVEAAGRSFGLSKTEYLALQRAT